jgi:hypothetical protein
MWRCGLALLLVAATACGADHAGPAASAASTHRTPATGQPTDRWAAATVRDERGRGLVQLTEADDGRIVLVDMGQRLVLSLGGAAGWVPPYLVGPRGATGQDRPLYLQEATGWPTAVPAGARLLAGNPGDVVVASHRAACGSACGASMTFQVRVYVNTVPKR